MRDKVIKIIVENYMLKKGYVLNSKNIKKLNIINILKDLLYTNNYEKQTITEYIIEHLTNNQIINTIEMVIEYDKENLFNKFLEYEIIVIV